MSDIERAKELIGELKQTLAELNETVSRIPMWEKAKAQLFDHYSVYAYGSPRIGGPGTRPIFDHHTSDPERARALRDDSIVHRKDYRLHMRAQGVPEPRIWESYPALDDEERLDRDTRLEKWRAKHSAIRETPFEVFTRKEIHRIARQRKVSPESLAKDEAVLAQIKVSWEDIEAVAKLLNI